MPRRRAADPFSPALLGTGLILALVAGGLQLTAWVQTTTYRQAGVRMPWVPWAEPAPEAPAPPASASPALPAEIAHLVDRGDAADAGIEPATAASDAALSGGPPATARPDAHPSPRRLRIPTIGVDSAVVDLGITERGEWELPTVEMGWYRHTTAPGAVGNAVLVGHVNDSWGLPRVFARLKDVRLGDTIEVESAPAAGATVRLVRYVVSEKRLVPSTAIDVMDPTADARLTLFTCAGTWDFLRGEYSHRQLVVARRVAA